MAKLFLSYDRDDTVTASAIAGALEKAGHEVWWDRLIRGGAEYSVEIEQALSSADKVIVLWSATSVKSAWVRDEAAVGRDRGCLIPVTIGPIEPPMGFRQFQSINLEHWKPKRKSYQFDALAKAVGAPPHGHAHQGGPALSQLSPPSRLGKFGKAIVLGVTAAIVISVGAWHFLGRSSLPMVTIAAADASPQSGAMASDLLVKLGGLAQIGHGKFQISASEGARAKGDLILRAADTGSDAQPLANLVLLDGGNRSVLWSRQFSFPAGQKSDLRQQVALTAGRVLACAGDAREQRSLGQSLLTQFLEACASLADLQADDYDRLVRQLHSVVKAEPNFKAAWSLLLLAESALAGSMPTSDAERDEQRQLVDDLSQVKSVFPDIPEIAIAEVRGLAPTNFADRIRLLDEAARRAPDNAAVLAELSAALNSVGRLADALTAAHESAILDPLSPIGATNYIMMLAYSGQVDTARDELAKATKLWEGTGPLKAAQLAFLTRFGDPMAALRLDSSGHSTAAYFNARKDPSPANIAALKAKIDEFRGKTVDASQVAWAVQGLAEFSLIEDTFYWLDRLSNDGGADISYVLFRPALAAARRDARFLPFAARVGLVRYWRSSGRWPDFCNRPGIPYDCKTEARRLQLR